MDNQDVRSRLRRHLPRTVGVAALLTGAAIGIPLLAVNSQTPPGRNGTAAAATLKPFDSCDSVLGYFKDQAPDYLIDRLGGRGRGIFERWETAGDIVPGATAADAGGRAAESGASQPHSTTNVQEAGVDEPDLVKTDGDRIVAVAQNRVHLVGVSGGEMTLRKTLPEQGANNVFLSGDHLLVFGTRADPDLSSELRWGGQQAVLTLYDIANLDQPRRIASLSLDGTVLDARMVGSQVRVATASSPDVDAPSPVYTPNGSISRRSKDQLREAVGRSTIDDWVPTYTLHDGAGWQVGHGRLVNCADLARPADFSGLDTVAVSAFDLGSALQGRRSVGVIAGGDQIYATDTSTYVSTTEWSLDGSPATTSLHKFVTAPSGASSYQGSGAVPGTLLNQYAMSEHRGVLRVASTVSEQRGWVNARGVTEGVVTILREQDGTLHQMGQVGGLGREDNESIQAVRFIEDRGYVVTYRRTDPLYVLDLRDAAAPKVVGELKIPGYSGYLHPIGDDRLLGVGQSGESGVQFSLFDISDPALPRRIDTQTYGSGAAAAEFDPKAFLYWQPRSLIVAPTSLYGDHQGTGGFSGLVLLRADADELTELGRLATSEADGMAQRSLVIGDTVYMLTEQALQAHSLDTHAELDKLTF